MKLTPLFVAGIFATVAVAQEITPTMGIDLPVLGQVAPRAAKDIASSPWSIGGETLDRDFAAIITTKNISAPSARKASASRPAGPSASACAAFTISPGSTPSSTTPSRRA